MDYEDQFVKEDTNEGDSRIAQTTSTQAPIKPQSSTYKICFDTQNILGIKGEDSYWFITS